MTLTFTFGDILTCEMCSRSYWACDDWLIFQT